MIFHNILYRDLTGLGGVAGFQDLKVELPTEYIIGVAAQGLLMPNLLLELDVVFKQWGSANTFKDVYDDQTLFLLGAEYQMGKITLRAGYSYAENMIRSTPNSTLHNLDGLGQLPLGPGSPVPAFSQDLVGLVQTSLLPVVWKHNISAGLGYSFGAANVDLFISYAFEEELEYTAPSHWWSGWCCCTRIGKSGLYWKTRC